MKNRKNQILAAAAVIVIAVAAVIFLRIRSSAADSETAGLYNGLEWGTAFDEVQTFLAKNTEGTITNVSELALTEEEIENYGGIYGLDAEITYMFDDDGLCLVVVDLINNGEIEEAEVFKTLYNGCRETFGEPSQEKEGSGALWEMEISAVALMKLDEENTFTIAYSPLEEETEEEQS